MNTCAYPGGEIMTDLLVRPETFRNRIENFGYEYLSFETRKLAQGRRYEAETGGNELAIVVLGGVCSVQSSRGEWRRIGGRKSVFEGLPYTLYLSLKPASRLWPIAIATWPFATAALKKNIPRGW